MTDERFRQIYRIESSRLKNWDYSQAGWYFVTICAKDKLLYFENKRIKEIVRNYWQEIPLHFNNIRLGEWVIMPNHIHGIIEIIKSNFGVETLHATNEKDLTPGVETLHATSLPKLTKRSDNSKNNKFYSLISPKSGNLAVVIRSFKSSVSRQCRRLNLEFVWQTRFYDHIIVDEREYYLVEEYIRNNPENWQYDPNNLKSHCKKMDNGN